MALAIQALTRRFHAENRSGPLSDAFEAADESLSDIEDVVSDLQGEISDLQSDLAEKQRDLDAAMRSFETQRAAVDRAYQAWRSEVNGLPDDEDYYDITLISDYARQNI